MTSSYELVRTLYKNVNGEPFEMTPSQCELFDLIFKKKYPRNHIMTYTQFGKSDIVAMAVLTRASSFAEPWAIIAPTKDKTKIIMGYVIQHTFDNPFTLKQLEIADGESLERIRRERSKNKLTFKVKDGFGEIYILSAQAGRVTSVESALMGFGSPNVVEDESALVPDKIHSTVMRMLGGHKNNFLVKIGNPFKRNHFLRSHNNPKYHNFFVDYKMGIAEDRIDADYIEEMKKEKMFDILYECKFPEEDSIDEAGWMTLYKESEITSAMQQAPHFGEERMGVDPADTGDNESVIAKRSVGYAEILFADRKIDLMDFAGQIILNLDNINSKRIYFDKVGIGAGAYSRLDEVNRQRLNKKDKFLVLGINAGETPADTMKFTNKRAEMFWRQREWIKGGGKLSDDKRWLQLLSIKYKVDSAGKIKIMGKEEMLKHGIDSPDYADALSLTFYDPATTQMITSEERHFMQQKRLKQIKHKKAGAYGLSMT